MWLVSTGWSYALTQFGQLTFMGRAFSRIRWNRHTSLYDERPASCCCWWNLIYIHLWLWLHAVLHHHQYIFFCFFPLCFPIGWWATSHWRAIWNVGSCFVSFNAGHYSVERVVIFYPRRNVVSRRPQQQSDWTSKKKGRDDAFWPLHQHERARETFYAS